MNIAVYCGSSFGDDPAFIEAAEKLGAWIAGHGHRLIYGGSTTGLMGTVANAVLAHGGEVVGVELRLLADQGLAHPGLTELVIEEDLAARRARMVELADAFVALPGGIGTLDELSEVATLARLGILDKPCVALDVNGYYRPLRELYEEMFAHGFLPQGVRGVLRFAGSVEELAELLG